MRITNRMMTNNMLSNINRNKVKMNTLEQQYSTGKKIQKPSDDPIITVRALKLRTNLSELEQYYNKNIPDAKSWMDVTESALTTVNSLLKQINTYCVQGSTDTLVATNRASIVKNLEQMKEQIYQEINSNYAGRYVFTGYKTDTSFTFMEDRKDLQYNITEHFTGEDIRNVSVVTDCYELKDYEDSSVNFDDPPKMLDTYRIQLSYDRIDADNPNGTISYTLNGTTGSIDYITVSSIDDDPATPDAYAPAPGEAHLIYETGELILGEDAYKALKSAEDISITYSKSEFTAEDIRPEHYFYCEQTNTDTGETITYEKIDPATGKPIDQPIKYEINYNQKLTINTESSDAISHGIGRDIEDILNKVNDVISVENKITEVKKWMEDPSLSGDEIKRCEKMLEQLDTELELKQEIMQDAFANGITSSSEEQDRVNTALADLGSRYVRLELTENRLASQKVDFEELLSTNEDVDIVDTVINYGAAQTIYNASLSAAAKLVQNTLLNFL